MDVLLGLGPLVLLLIGVAWIVWRGLRSDTHTHDTGVSDATGDD